MGNGGQIYLDKLKSYSSGEDKTNWKTFMDGLSLDWCSVREKYFMHDPVNMKHISVVISVWFSLYLQSQFDGLLAALNFVGCSIISNRNCYLLF